MTGHGQRGKIFVAALAYWACIFALGFILGTLRVLLLAPAIGEFAAVIAELPVMLIASWLAARWLVVRLAIKGAIPALSMGALAFVLLIGSEAVLFRLLTDSGPGQWIEGMITPPGLVGLAGQVAFALFPSLVGSRLKSC